MITEYIIVKGLVQGVGYRPFAAEQAQLNNITGRVRNSAGVVTISATGTPDKLADFVQELRKGCRGSRVDEVIRESAELTVYDGFAIINSKDEDWADIPYISSDLPTCERCAAELEDKNNRRYGHPFISCTVCGPRYSIMESLPYDRQNTLMKEFKMCNNCIEDYSTGVRHYAQTTACNDCGPKLLWNGRRGSVQDLIKHLIGGGIAAVKDIGGFHLTCMPDDSDAVRRLREIKARDNKPFAVLFPDINTIKEYCYVNAREEQELLSNPRPIVLLKHREDGKSFDYGVCMNSSEIGCMLPSNPIQIMLSKAVGAVVMTSANISGGLMITDNDDMRDWLRERMGMEEYETECGILSHDRGIITPLDDSVVRVVAGRRQMIRRARGFVPEPVNIKVKSGIFATGGDLKSVFCYTADNRAYLSQQLGDLEEERIYREYNKECRRFKTLFGFDTKLVTADLHPKYLSGQGNKDYRSQHHKAHVASVIAEHHLTGDIIGIAFDGTGYGEDGSVWGSEVFLYKNGFSRIAHLKEVSLTGGNEGSRNAESIMYGYIDSFEDNVRHELLQGSNIDRNRYELTAAAIKHNINRITSCSMGRLFDAVSAFLGICLYSSYEGEAAIELEYAAAKAKEAYPLKINTICSEMFIGDTQEMFSDIYRAMEAGVSVTSLARGFIAAVADWIIGICDEAVIRYGLSDVSVALSGGTFLNRILLEMLSVKFAEKGLKWYINEQVPSGDGGLCLGQAFLASENGFR